MAITQDKIKITIEKIRKVMPNVMASQIVAVQPLSPAQAQVFTLGKYKTSTWVLGQLEMQKKHYQHFLRAYNRRKQQKVAYLVELGYQCIKIDSKYTNKEAKQWCQRYVKDGAWISNNQRFIFAYDKDAMLFTLKFAS